MWFKSANETPCKKETTSWSGCSVTCGTGESIRVTSDNEGCQPLQERRVCMVRPCDMAQHGINAVTESNARQFINLGLIILFIRLMRWRWDHVMVVENVLHPQARNASIILTITRLWEFHDFRMISPKSSAFGCISNYTMYYTVQRHY